MKTTNRKLPLISGLSLGAGLMYVFDPQIGRRRRAVARDKVVHFRHKTADAIDVSLRDLKNRTFGLAAAAQGLFLERPISDRLLANRIRSKLGFLVSHPSSIEISVKDGVVGLTGPILENEVDRLLRGVALVKGVKGVENHLEVHQSAESIPGLQGEPGERLGQRLDIMQSSWSPATRLLVGIAAGASMTYAIRRRGMVGAAIAVLGGGMLSRALANIEFKRLLGIGAGARAIDIQKIINVAAPVDQVFSFWSRYENFPRFMSNVREVREIGEQRSRWTVAGPAGAPVQWDAVTTNYVPNQSVGWETLPGSPIQHAGIARFQPNADGTTRLEIRMSYNPVAGGLGHAIASLFGADPKSEMDDDLMRMKSMIETGVQPHDAARRNEERGYIH
jgi:uncharacterized membrane protein